MKETTTVFPRRGEYGFDGNMTGVAGAVSFLAASLAATAALTAAGLGTMAAVTTLISALLLIVLGFWLHTTRRGKFLVWAEILHSLPLDGGERVLDVGCGLGAVLTMTAEHLPRGRVVGIDLWTADQSGNCIDAAQRNLTAEGVQERCEVVTGDMTSLPFPDGSFDLIVSSLAIHNVHTLTERIQALDEIARVLVPGGRVAIADLAWTGAYARRLEALGFLNVRRRRLGWRFWWGPGYPATTLVTATKPRSS